MEEINRTMETVDEITEQGYQSEPKQWEAGEESGQEERQNTGFWKDDRGVGVIEIVLILVVLIGLVLVFKDQITSVVNSAFASITGDAGQIIK